MAQLRVLVFGETGSGKTSICNALTGAKKPASSSARGVTFETSTFDPVSIEGGTLILTDTVGLNESDKGTVNQKDAAKRLLELLVKSMDGYNLLIHVMQGARITKALQNDYEFFVNKIASGRVPVLLVRTGGENEEPMSAWVDNNRPEFVQQGFLYKDILSTCFAAGGRLEAHYAPLRLESTKAVLAAITKLALAEPHKLYTDDESFSETLRRIWNGFAEWVGLPEEYRMKVNDGVYDLIKKLGVPEEYAKWLKMDVKDLAKAGLRELVQALLKS